jgi:hypothetical protein
MITALIPGRYLLFSISVPAGLHCPCAWPLRDDSLRMVASGVVRLGILIKGGDVL